MKVIFIGQEGQEPCALWGASALREGREYVVLEAEFLTGGANKFRIEVNCGEFPPLFDSRLFKVVDSTLSSAWTVSINWDGSVTMAPPDWQDTGFWENFSEYFDAAIESYEYWRNFLFSESRFGV
ncbi:hypothetical protein ACOQFL_12795 [Actinopolyspora sp. H202]|uniref:hypothetical protein n=1 Tax=Actinopolyspora sp. H202 TaxID=1500456 RepID=UPI003EE7C4BB